MARYTPSTVADPVVNNELQKIAQALDQPDAIFNLDPIYAAPKKFREGAIVFAKAPWNPGSGDGIYCYRTGAWRFLG